MVGREKRRSQSIPFSPMAWAVLLCATTPFGTVLLRTGSPISLESAYQCVKEKDKPPFALFSMSVYMCLTVRAVVHGFAIFLLLTLGAASNPLSPYSRPGCLSLHFSKSRVCTRTALLLSSKDEDWKGLLWERNWRGQQIKPHPEWVGGGEEGGWQCPQTGPKMWRRIL